MSLGSTNFQIAKDVNNNVAYGLFFCNSNFSTALVAGTEQTLVVPSSQENWMALFTYSVGNNVYVADSTIMMTAPTGSFAACQYQINPPLRQVRGGDTLRFLTNDTGGAAVVVSFYALQAYV